jgi:hypothetical protein
VNSQCWLFTVHVFRKIVKVTIRLEKKKKKSNLTILAKITNLLEMALMDSDNNHMTVRSFESAFSQRSSV